MEHITKNLMSVVASINPHRGVVLPEARFIIVLVPVALFVVYWFVLRRRKG